MWIYSPFINYSFIKIDFPHNHRFNIECECKYIILNIYIYVMYYWFRMAKPHSTVPCCSTLVLRSRWSYMIFNVLSSTMLILYQRMIIITMDALMLHAIYLLQSINFNIGMWIICVCHANIIYIVLETLEDHQSCLEKAFKWSKTLERTSFTC